MAAPRQAPRPRKWQGALTLLGLLEERMEASEREEAEADDQEAEARRELLSLQEGRAQIAKAEIDTGEVAVVGEAGAPDVVHAWQRATRAAKRRRYPTPEPAAVLGAGERYCPNRECNMRMFNMGRECNELRCSNCATRFCRECGGVFDAHTRYHVGCGVAPAEAAAAEEQEELQQGEECAETAAKRRRVGKVEKEAVKREGGGVADAGIVGARVRKHFPGHGEFEGRVESQCCEVLDDEMEAVELYAVRYEDGDWEELTWEELRELMV